MTKSPIINALSATLYIVIIGSVLFLSSRLAPTTPTVLIPVTILSLFVLSVIVMALCFFYQPVLLFIEGDRRQATRLFLQTVATFAALTALVGAILLYVSR